MDKKRSRHRSGGNAGIALSLPEFLDRLHKAIGGSGPPWSSPAEFEPFGRDLPDHTLGIEEFRVEYLWSHILSKYDDGKSSDRKRDAAIEKLRSAEQHCSLQASRFRSSRSEAISFRLTGDAISHGAAAKIRRVLGEFSWEDCVDRCDFGPGASTKLPRRRSDRWHKFGSHPDISTECEELARAYFLGERPAWGRFLSDKYGSLYTICDSNRITTVPKNYKTDRPIAIEPLLNMFFQKGIGSCIRSKLRTVGQDLNDQTRNQVLALQASKDGRYATIDLSSASDTISTWVVEHLLPPDWYAALEQCRTRYGVLDSGERLLYRKFSSMGNGFTFELESLIFWGICSYVVDVIADDMGTEERLVSVYGDDIIVPVDAAAQVMRALELFGFIPNDSKSHIMAANPFRESCGMHGFWGQDVTPFYIRGPIKSLTDLFLLHNNVMRWSMKRCYASRDARLMDLCTWLRSHAPDKWRKPRICDGYGDGAFIGSFDECTPRLIRKRGWQGYRVEHLTVATKDLDSYEGPQRLFRTLHSLAKAGEMSARMMGTRATLGRPDIPLIPSRQAGWRITTSIVFRWTDLPPWVNLDPQPKQELQNA